MIRSVSSKWHDAILVCRKCTKRVGGGFGAKGRTSLAKVLRAAGVGGKTRKASRGIVETGCLGLCPNKAVVVLNTARPDGWLVVAPGTDPGQVVLALGIGPRLDAADRRQDDDPARGRQRRAADMQPLE